MPPPRAHITSYCEPAIIIISYGINAMFTSQLLASVGMDDQHTLVVWDWRKGKPLSTTRGHSDRIFDVQFNPYMSNTLVTCGVKHIKFWSLCGNSLSGKKGIFGKKGTESKIILGQNPRNSKPLFTVLSCTFATS